MKFKIRPFFKDVSFTFITQGIVLIAFFIIYRLIAKKFGPEGVGEYSLVKKVIGFLQPILFLGLGIGLPRYIAMSQNKEQRSSYIKIGGSVVAVFTFVFLIFINLSKDYFAKIFFGTINYRNLVLPFSFFLAGLILHSLVYSYFRGRLFVKTFNSLQIINIAFVPIVILIFVRNITFEKLITLIGITTIVISFITSLFFIKEIFGFIEKTQIRKSLKELLIYSLPRVTGSFAHAALLSVGPIFAAHLATIQEVGYLSVSQGLLGSVGAMVTPLGIILLPKVSNLMSKKREEEIKENLNFLISAIFQLSIFISLQLIIFTDIIIKYWLGPDFKDAVIIMQVIFSSLFFYLLYGTTESILDATKVEPINTINLVISLGVFLFVSMVLLFLIKSLPPVIGLSLALTTSIWCLGILSYISIRKIYSEKFSKDLKYILIALFINVVLGKLTILMKPFLILNFYYLIIYEVIIAGIYLSILWIIKTDWLRQIPLKIITKKAGR